MKRKPAAPTFIPNSNPRLMVMDLQQIKFSLEPFPGATTEEIMKCFQPVTAFKFREAFGTTTTTTCGLFDHVDELNTIIMDTESHRWWGRTDSGFGEAQLLEYLRKVKGYVGPEKMGVARWEKDEKAKIQAAIKALTA